MVMELDLGEMEMLHIHLHDKAGRAAAHHARELATVKEEFQECKDDLEGQLEDRLGLVSCFYGSFHNLNATCRMLWNHVPFIE